MLSFPVHNCCERDIGKLYSRYILLLKEVIELLPNRPRGLMEKASDFGSEDSRFESWRGRFVHLKRDLSLSSTARVRDYCRQV